MKFVLIGIGMVASIGLLIYAGLGGDGYVYYKTVTEYLQTGVDSTDGFRVNGKVVEGSIERFPSGEDVRFVMSDGQTAMTVMYHGIIPDTFVDDADVVVKGALGQDEVFRATEMLAKCPSKYEAAEGYEEGGAYGEPGYGKPGEAPADGGAGDGEEIPLATGRDVTQLRP